MKKYILLIGIGGWLLMALFFIFQIPLISTYRCYFQTSWLFCSAVLSQNLKIILSMIIGLLTGVFIFYGWKNWQWLTDAVQIYNKKIISLLLGLMAVCALMSAPFGSGDLTYYFSVGKAVRQKINPFTQSWEQEKTFDASAANPVKINGFMYGPITASVFELFYNISGGKVLIFILLWKFFMIVMFISCGILIKKLITIFSKNFSTNCWYIFWFSQPLLLFEWIVNGHFDSLWLFFVLAALYSASQKKWWIVIPCLFIGIWIKFIPLLITPWFIIWWWQDLSKDTLKKNILSTFIGLVLGLIITWIVWFPYWQGWMVFEPIILQSKWAVMSFFSVIYYTLKPLFLLVFSASAHYILTRLVQGGLLFLIIWLIFPYLKELYQLIFRKKNWEQINYVQAIFVSLFIYVSIWQKSFWPWYMAWLIPFGFITYITTQNIFLKKILRYISVSPFIFYPIWLINWLWQNTDSAPLLWFACVVVGSIWVYPWWQLFKWRKLQYNQVR